MARPGAANHRGRPASARAGCTPRGRGASGRGPGRAARNPIWRPAALKATRPHKVRREYLQSPLPASTMVEVTST
jgi:hypothetical protein